MMSETLISKLNTEEEFQDIIFPPGNLWSDEPELESDLHRRQIEILVRLLEWLWRDRTDYYASGNLTIYYSPKQQKSTEFRGPDFFVVKGCQKKDRRSWVVWEENGQYPHVIVEILSSSTAATDKGLKKQIYQDVFRTPDYFWFDPESLELKGFHLVEGVYEAIEPTENGSLWSPQLQLYLGLENNVLRFYLPSGELVLLPEEETQQALAETQRELEASRSEVERLRAILKAQGIEEI